MKTKTIIALFIWLIMSPGITKSYSKENNIHIADSLLWEINGPDIEKPSYLAGTFHIMCEQDFSIDDRFKDAIEEAEQLYLEIDFDDSNEKANMMQAMFVNESLKDRLSDIQYEQLSDVFSKNTQFTLDKFDKMTFLAIQSTLFAGMMDCPIIAFDEELMKLAQNKQQAVYGLETVKDQLAAAKTLAPKKAEKAWSKDELELLFGSKTTIEDMLTLYKQQKIQDLYDLVNHQFTMTNDTQLAKNAILNQRNINWTKQIPKIISETPTFFAVGAGHLAGEKGVINLLRASGLTVTPVFN